MKRVQPWSPAIATNEIRAVACNPALKISLTAHVKERLAERDLIVGDALYVLKHGFVYEPPTGSTQPGLFKYRMETRTPNSGTRVVRLVLIPDADRLWVKLVTVMWVDE